MSGHKGQKRQGLQVLKLSNEPGRRYELDEEALASLLLRPEVRRLPVVVVSVAGAYRGGKSFILDFFLRYLNVPRSSQLSTEWLGDETDPLEGFDWRGGSETNTKGIHLWPEPIIATIEKTGEKVAVLLMDTQGTFDTETDMDDNSTIFALSTLLSSVQIYNLRANIGEDDLQHLQLFTEYGRLASDGDGKAFQTLLFLVRDWMSPSEHAHGYDGGQALLNKKLAPRKNQRKQLLEVRQHINSCFEKLQCFLMPHPGLVVAENSFKGRLCDIQETFRMSLLELVPSLFDSNNLAPKIIGGNKVQAQDFLEYFKQYVNIFNSDDIPEATTIFQATAAASVMSALREARGTYESDMDSKIIDEQSVTPSMLREWHSAAIDNALKYFHSKKKLGSQENVEAQLQELRKELESRLSWHLWQNEAKIRETMSIAKKAYEECVSAVCVERARLCLHARDLAALHERAAGLALEELDRSRPNVPRAQDEERKNLIQNLDELYRHLCAVNEQNNKSAKVEARELYLSRMREQSNQAGVSTELLMRQHDKIMKEAIKHFLSHRNCHTKQAKDPEVEQLQDDIASFFEDFKTANTKSNLWALQVAEFTYNNCVTSAWGPQSCCFHPQALAALHDSASARAMEQFLRDRHESVQDDFKDKLVKKLATRYEELVKINEFNNQQAVEQAFGEYTRRMDKHSQPSLSSFLVVPFLVKVLAMLPRYHDSARRRALEIFAERRRGGSYSADHHMSTLKKKIDDAFDDYKDIIQALAREVGIV